MCKEHLISIIVPVYNVENKIRRCLDCLVNQSYKNIEIILVNDGSTDDSGAICDRYAAGDERVRVIHKKNGGVSSARNRGLDEASGLYIMFVDSDDYIEKNACEVMIDAIEKYGVDLIVASYNTVYNGKVMRHICPEKVYSRVSDIKEDFRLIYMDCFLNSPWNKLFKKQFITKRFDENMRYFEDYYFVLDYIDNIRSLATTDIPLYYYIEDIGNSLTKVFREDTFDVFPKIYKRQLEFCHKYIGTDFDDELKSSLLYGFYNTAQKLVYSKGGKLYKIDMIDKWMENDAIKSIDKSYIEFVNNNCGSQFKTAYAFILNRQSEKLYNMLMLKKTVNPALQFIKKIIKGSKKQYDINKPNR